MPIAGTRRAHADRNYRDDLGRSEVGASACARNGDEDAAPGITAVVIYGLDSAHGCVSVSVTLSRIAHRKTVTPR